MGLFFRDVTSSFPPGYSPLDFSVVDPHFGNIETWQNAIDEIHKRNMYIILDFTVGTMNNLVGFKG